MLKVEMFFFCHCKVAYTVVPQGNSDSNAPHQPILVLMNGQGQSQLVYLQPTLMAPSTGVGNDQVIFPSAASQQCDDLPPKYQF